MIDNIIRFLRIVKRSPTCIVKGVELTMHSLLYSYSTLRDEVGDMAELLVAGHVLEKGITMPNRRLGFGYERVRGLIAKCRKNIAKYGPNHVEIQSAISDLEQYYLIHQQNQYLLPSDIVDGIHEMLKYKRYETRQCFSSTPVDYFKKTNEFEEFSRQRHSLRWFSNEELNDEDILKAIRLAQTAPSACNRQSCKLYVVKDADKKQAILRLQNGNRGFGCLADRIILVTSDMRSWNCRYPTAPYVDAGIFTMNLLYAFHYYKIGACTLNAHLTWFAKRKLKKIVGYSEPEIPVLFIAIGNVPPEFMVNGSQRVETSDIYRML